LTKKKNSSDIFFFVKYQREEEGLWTQSGSGALLDVLITLITLPKQREKKPYKKKSIRIIYVPISSLV